LIIKRWVSPSFSFLFLLLFPPTHLRMVDDSFAFPHISTGSAIPGLFPDSGNSLGFVLDAYFVGFRSWLMV
jgi:hypothetical protein